MEITRLILPLTFIIGGFLIGVIFEKIILTKFKKITQKTKWQGTEIIINSLHRMTTFCFFIAGVYVAMHNLPIDEILFSALQKVLLVIIIFSVTLILAKLSVGFVRLYIIKTRITVPSTIFVNLTNLLIFLIGTLIILQTLGISITPIITALGVGGLAIALALQETLANLFSGLHIIIARKMKPGDYIKLDSGEEGYITDITWRDTTIRTLPNNIIIIPNSKLASTIITNYNLPEREIGVTVQVGVSYESDLEKVEKVTIEVAKEVLSELPDGVSEFEPFIRYHTFNDFSINFTVILRAKEFVNQYLLKHEFIKRLHKRYQKEGIEIPFPIRTVYMKNKK